MSSDNSNTNPNDPLYTPEQLQWAKEQLAAMTPEGYLLVVADLQAAQAQASMPEARGVAFTELFPPWGGKINVTARAESGSQAVRDIVATIQEAYHNFNMTVIPGAAGPLQPTATGASVLPPATGEVSQSQPFVPNLPNVHTPPQPQATTPAPVKSSAGASFKVESLTHTVAGQTHLLVVKGGPYKKFGFKAWPEKIPNTVDFQAWSIGVENAQVPPEMAYAVVDPTGKKIAYFSPTQP